MESADESNRVAVSSAVFAFKDRHGAYPPSLDALVPEFIPAIPKQRGGMSSRFYYSVRDGRPWLSQPYILSHEYIFDFKRGIWAFGD